MALDPARHGRRGGGFRPQFAPGRPLPPIERNSAWYDRSVLIATFHVRGKAQTKGSYHAVPNQRWMKGDRTARAVVFKPPTVAQKTWGDEIRKTAKIAMNGPPLPRGVPVGIEIFVRKQRPVRHHISSRRVNAVKPDAPLWVDVKPDPDKIARLVLDAMTGVVYEDDAQVAYLTVFHLWHIEHVTTFCISDLSDEHPDVLLSLTSESSGIIVEP
jgi:Holliday junction resolvase RusA-like endonuclease